MQEKWKKRKRKTKEMGHFSPRWWIYVSRALTSLPIETCKKNGKRGRKEKKKGKKKTKEKGKESSLPRESSNPFCTEDLQLRKWDSMLHLPHCRLVGGSRAWLPDPQQGASSPLLYNTDSQHLWVSCTLAFSSQQKHAEKEGKRTQFVEEFFFWIGQCFSWSALSLGTSVPGKLLSDSQITALLISLGSLVLSMWPFPKLI